MKFLFILFIILSTISTAKAEEVPQLDVNQNNNGSALDASNPSPENGKNIPLAARLFASDQAQKEQEEVRAQKEMKQAEVPAGSSEISEADRRSIFLAMDHKDTFAYDWWTGEQLTEEMVKRKQLFVPKKNGLLTFDAQKGGPTKPFKLTFAGAAICEIASAGSGRWQHVDLKVCLEKGKSCKNGCALCYVGKLDPANRPELLDNFQVPNLPGQPDPCSAQKEEWMAWKNKVLHGVRFETDPEGNIVITTTFSDKKKILKPDDEQCIHLQISTETEPIGKISDAEHKEHADGSWKETWFHLANNQPFAALSFLNILPFDVFSNFNETEETPLFAFVSSEGCGFEISFDGPLQRCTSEKCESQVEFEPHPGMKKRDLYSGEFAELKPILSPEQLPSQYKNKVVLEKRGGHPVATITTTGEEIVFAVVTLELVPPILTVFHPPRAIECTVKGKFELNEFVLAYNGRPDCYGRFSWGERKMRFRDNMDISNDVLGVKDVPIMFKGPNGDEIWARDQMDDELMLGRVTCPIEAPKYHNPRQMDKMPNEGYIWQFILNPRKSPGTPVIEGSRCTLGVYVNLDDNFLLLSDADPDTTVSENSEGTTTTTEAVDVEHEGSDEKNEEEIEAELNEVNFD